jgi:hypothetical protein
MAPSRQMNTTTNSVGQSKLKSSGYPIGVSRTIGISRSVFF